MLALNSKIYRNTASHGSPAWSEVAIFENVQVNPSYDRGDANTRESRAKREANTQMMLEVTGRLKVRPADANYQAFEDAFVADSAIDLLVLNGPIDDPGVSGWRADFGVRTFTEDQGLGNVLYKEVTLTPADTDNEVVAVRVEGTGSAEEAEIGEGF
ncbi:MAG TPA: hypothetical protein VD866_31275 [Urbifossiella sp.]|nr:hypothetical protein [Urbifossiella sp.]